MKKALSLVLALAVGTSSVLIPAMAYEDEGMTESEEMLSIEDVGEAEEAEPDGENAEEAEESVLTREMAEAESAGTESGSSEEVLSRPDSESFETDEDEEFVLSDYEISADIILSEGQDFGDEKGIKIQAYSDPLMDTEFRIYFWDYDGILPNDADQWLTYFKDPYCGILFNDMSEERYLRLPVYSDETDSVTAELVYDGEDDSFRLEFTLPAASYVDTEVTAYSAYDEGAGVMAQALYMDNETKVTASYLPIDFNADIEDAAAEDIEEAETESGAEAPFLEEEDEEFEQETEDDGIYEFDTMYFVNPVYEGIITEDDLDHTEAEDAGIATLSSSRYAETLDDAGADMRDAMEMRETPFTIKYIYPGTSIDSAGLTELMWDVWDVAFAHTGVSTEGDYMRWQYGGWSLSASYAKGDGFLYLNMVFNVTYYSTYEEEQEVTAKLSNVFADLNLGCKGDYDRVKAVYDYICSNIVYDYDNLYDSSYMTKFSAYGALCNGTAVCQGYAVLLYRMLLEAGVDCRVVTGSGNGGAHAWNIVCLDGKYYNVDSTWDAGRRNYAYFLKCDSNFTSHSRGSDYSTSAFYGAYPMGSTDYDASNAGGSHHTLGEWEVVKEAGCTEAGLRRQYCTVCGELVNEETIKAVGHDYFSETAQPTCELEGAVVMTCEHCGDTYIAEVLPAAGHNYKEEVLKAATCTEEGYSKFTCTICGDEYVGGHTDPLGHDFVEIVSDPTCIEAGQTVSVCQRCGAQYVTAFANPTGVHDYVDGVCTLCGHLEETEAEEHIHDFVRTEGVDSSCGTNGRWTYECSCGETMEVVVPATGDHVYALIDYKEPTCTEHGYASYDCLFCSSPEGEYTDELPAMGHDFADPVLTLAPECEEEGILTVSCNACGESYEEAVPATGHHSVEQADGSWVCELCGLVTAEAPEPQEEEPEPEEDVPDEEEFEELSKYDITKAVITGIEEDYVYTGGEVMPEPVVTYDGKVLEKDVDYVLVYAHDVEIGYASVSVVGIGDYYGDVTFHYMIEAVEHGDEPDLLDDYEEDETEGKQADNETESEKKDDETEAETYAEGGGISADNDGDEEETESESESELTNTMDDGGTVVGTGDGSGTDDDDGQGLKGTVQTGDDFNLTYLILSLIAAAGLAAAGFAADRRRKASR